ncbi:virulence-associated E family protein [Ruegeria aquimaris]|uniref:Virulence-associated E family protein n=1 Tax=Ruegeria aquimaris TaxID=2984333 RepID=A0ABT3APR3_9RHOB|nr:virulence-associated E family protein [Ruegeria sp. XHP0148]MCV2890682.1 virulence-associated E family protein [Ruegeria sp. XHP0148]
MNKDVLMADLENVIIRISVGNGTSLGRVTTKQKTWRTFRAMFDPEKVLVDTSCTYAQYKKLDQDQQGKKKLAAGNWMPALFKDGRRKGPNQLCRTMVAFDLDYVTIEQLEHIRDGGAPINQYAWHMHTTRSHCPEKPRVRMSIPLSREVTLDEANALTRILATLLADDPEEGIEIPDIVSMKANQVMYLPSRSRDQEYWTDENEGELLDVDEFLIEYPFWEDHTLLPHKEAETNRGKVDPNRKMEDPRDKQGYIGAFCRTYDIEEAIAEFIPEVYTPGDSSTETRYTFALGTGSNGAVVYDGGLFIYSNHGSDPIEGAANAWDMVRVHKFGHLDKDAPPNTSLSNLPSSKAMMELAKADKAVAAELFAHMREELDDEFEDDEGEADDGPSIDDLLGGFDDDEEPEADDAFDGLLDDADEDEKPKKKQDKGKDEDKLAWTANFRRKANGELEPVLNNIALICSNDGRIARAVAYNEFTHDPYCVKPIRSKLIALPSRELVGGEKKKGRRWEDADDASVKLIASANKARNGYETDFSSQSIQEAVLIAGRMNPIHPVKDYIQACYERWLKAGAPTGKLDRIAIDYFGCPDTPFHRESARWFFTGAVARIYEPGCKFDQMLILEGATGAGKSTWLKGISGWFCHEFRVDLDNVQRTVEAMRGAWFLEMDEMVKAKSSDSALLKSFLSSPVDKIRLAYAKREMEFPRQSVMVGTSNENDYLTDPTSVRRYWVWKVHPRYDEFNLIDQDKLMSERHLLIGEAYQAYLDMRKANPHGDLHLGLKTNEAIREQRQIAEGSRRKTATEVIAEFIQEWLDRPVNRDEMEVHSHSQFDREFDDEADSGERFIRNMVTAKQAFEALHTEAVLEPYRNAEVRTYGKALKLIPGWTDLGKVVLHKQRAVWFRRTNDDAEWIAAPADPETRDTEIDDLLN